MLASIHRHGPARPEDEPEHTGKSEFGHADGPVDPPIGSGEDHDVLSTLPFRPPAWLSAHGARPEERPAQNSSSNLRARVLRHKMPVAGPGMTDRWPVRHSFDRMA